MSTNKTKLIIFVILSIVLLELIIPISVFASNVFEDFDVEIDETSGNFSAKTKDGDGTGWKGIIIKYKSFIVGVAGVAAVTMVALFIFQFIKLGQSAGNPQARSQALTGVLWTGVAAAGLGSVALITSLFYNSIKSTTAPTP